MEQSRRKSAISTIAISLVVGIVGLTTVTGRPRFSLYATVDVLQLLASGMCFGIALVGIVRSFRNSGAQ
jgi:TctA family transporter